MNQGPFQLLLQPFHGIPKHNFLDLPLLQRMHRHIVIGGLHKKNILRFYGKTELLGLIPEGDHLLLPELLGGVFCKVFQLCSLILHGEVEPGDDIGDGQNHQSDKEQA